MITGSAGGSESTSKPFFKTMHFNSATKRSSTGLGGNMAFGRPTIFRASNATTMQDIPEEGQMPSFHKTATGDNASPFAVPTIANLQSYGKTGKGGKPFGVRSLA